MLTWNFNLMSNFLSLGNFSTIDSILGIVSLRLILSFLKIYLGPNFKIRLCLSDILPFDRSKYGTSL